MTKKSKINRTSLRFELPSVRHHNHYIKEPTVSGRHSNLQLCFTGSSLIQLIRLIKRIQDKIEKTRMTETNACENITFPCSL